MPMQELEYDHNLFNNRFAADDKLYVRFFMMVLEDPVKTAELGVKKFREAEMVQIMVPGDKNNIVIREAREADKQRFEKHYERFKANQTEPDDGFPLAQWPMVNAAMVEELKYLGFRTVEHVAGANDSVLSKHAGLRELQRRAKRFVESQKSAAPLAKLEAENKAQEAQMKAMNEQMAKMSAMLEQLQAAQAKQAVAA